MTFFWELVFGASGGAVLIGLVLALARFEKLFFSAGLFAVEFEQ